MVIFRVKKVVLRSLKTVWHYSQRPGIGNESGAFMVCACHQVRNAISCQRLRDPWMKSRGNKEGKGCKNCPSIPTLQFVLPETSLEWRQTNHKSLDSHVPQTSSAVMELEPQCAHSAWLSRSMKNTEQPWPWLQSLLQFPLLHQLTTPAHEQSHGMAGSKNKAVKCIWQPRQPNRYEICILSNVRNMHGCFWWKSSEAKGQILIC